MTKTHANTPAILYQNLPKTVTKPQGVGIWKQIETDWQSNAIAARIPFAVSSQSVISQQAGQSSGKAATKVIILKKTLFPGQAFNGLLVKASGSQYRKWEIVVSLKKLKTTTKVIIFVAGGRLYFLQAFTLIVTIWRNPIVWGGGIFVMS